MFLVASSFFGYTNIEQIKNYFVKENPNTYLALSQHNYSIDVVDQPCDYQEQIKFEDFPNGLNWKTYYNYCLEPQNVKSNRIQTQMRCSHLDGSLLKWRGTVTSVEIHSVQNFFADIVYSYLPKSVVDFAACLYGEPVKSKCFVNESCDEVNQFITNNLQKKCSLDKWNT